MKLFGRNISIGNGAATNSILLMFVSVVTTVISLAITKLLSVYFSLQEYGTYSQAILVSTTTASLTLLGLSSAINYFYNRTPDVKEKQRYVSSIFFLEEIIGTVVAVVLFIFRGEIVKYFKNEDVKNLIIIVAFMPLLTNMIAMYQNLFVSIGRAKTIAIRNLVVSICRFISVLVACFITRDVKTILIVLLILDILQFLYFFLVFRRYSFDVSPKYLSPTTFKSILNFSIPLSIYTIAGSLANDIDKYVIGYFTNTDTLAIYTNASKRLPFDIITSSFITVLIPIITRLLNDNKNEEANKLFSLYMRFGCIISLICGGGCIALSNHIIVLLYDEKYISGLPIFVIYLVIEMIRFANVTIVLSATGQTKIMMISSISMLFLNAIFNVLSYKVFGWYGPAIVTLVLTIFTTLILLHFAAKTLNTHIIKLFDIKEMLIVSGEVIAFGMGFSFIYNKLCLTIYIPQICTLVVLALFGVSLGIINYKKIQNYIHKINSYK